MATDQDLETVVGAVLVRLLILEAVHDGIANRLIAVEATTHDLADAATQPQNCPDVLALTSAINDHQTQLYSLERRCDDLGSDGAKIRQKLQTLAHPTSVAPLNVILNNQLERLDALDSLTQKHDARIANLQSVAAVVKQPETPATTAVILHTYDERLYGMADTIDMLADRIRDVERSKAEHDQAIKQLVKDVRTLEATPGVHDLPDVLVKIHERLACFQHGLEVLNSQVTGILTTLTTHTNDDGIHTG